MWLSHFSRQEKLLASKMRGQSVLDDYLPRMGENGDIEVISFHSISKGLIGECGHRGGYYECFNVAGEILELLYKQSSICLCANVPGQIMVGMMVDPPKPGDASYELYNKELHAIWASLKRRALKMQNALASMSYVACNEAAGSMYLFPRINFPEKLIEHARFLNKQPDEVYAMDLLNATGIVHCSTALLQIDAFV